MYVFICCDPAYSGFVHLNMLCHIPEHKGFKVGNSLVKKTPLELNYAFRHLVYGSLALMYTLNEPCGGLHLVENVLLCFRVFIQ